MSDTTTYLKNKAKNVKLILDVYTYLQKKKYIRYYKRNFVYKECHSFRNVEMMATKRIDSNLTLFSKLMIYFDVNLSALLYGSSVQDYFLYRYWLLNRKGRKSFATERDLVKLNMKLNHADEKIYLDDKMRFHEKFSEYLHRDVLDTSATFEEYSEFITKHDEYIVKPTSRFGGKGIYLECVSEISENLKIHYQELQNSGCILEERIEQLPEMKFNPSSVNTIRVLTYNSNKEIQIMATALRMGVGNVVVDNASSGGAVAVVDKETGVICTNAVTMDMNEFSVHPISHKQILGYQIPQWDEVINTVKSAAQKLPNMCFIGWDVVININSEIVLIEGNTMPEFALHQHSENHAFGCWKDVLKKSINKLEK